MAFKRIATRTGKKTRQAKPSEYSYVVPMGAGRKKQLSKEVNDLFQGKRETVKACVSELIELIEDRNRESIPCQESQVDHTKLT